MRQALERISALAKAAATSDTNKRVVARHAALKQGGEQLMPVDVLADTAGAACSDDELGEKLRKHQALDGLPDERLGAALDNLVGTRTCSRRARTRCSARHTSHPTRKQPPTLARACV